MAQNEIIIERRFFTTEIRMEEVDGQRHIIGYAAMFNQLSEDLGGFREMIEEGAFSSALERPDDVRGLFNHNANMILGRNVSGTLNLRQDEIGLRYDILVPDTQYARDLLISMERGDVNQSSFGFRVITDRWEQLEEYHLRTLRDLKLFDVSPVTFPAYPVTSAEARARASKLSQQPAAAGGASSTADQGDAAATARRLGFRKRHLDLLERL